MKKKIVLTSLTLTTIVLIIAGCSKTSEDILAANSNIICDTTNVQYSVDVVSILSANCYRCHGATTNAGSGGIILEGYTNLKKWADNGFLIGNIKHLPPPYVPMPFDGGKLSDCDINKIQAWIDQGTKDN